MPTIDDKNETCRFLGEGVSFKAKLIGILEVSEARGDRMCQEALSDLKTAIRAAGEHKQRITINVAIDGLKLRDEKTGDSLYHHPVHKISFIAQDMTDSRAFGYIFGSPDTGHRFFGIKTDKAASQVVIAMRDLFQVVFALKKREVELAKQHLDKRSYGWAETIVNPSKVSSSTTETSKASSADSKTNTASSDRSTPAVADLVDLELELNSLQQGLHQMERITPSDPFGSKDDPFGDSFTPFPKAILPPPPSSGKERSSRTSETSSLFSPKTPQTGGSVDISGTDSPSLLYTPKEHEHSTSHNEPSSGDWFTPPSSNTFFEEQPLAPEQTKSNNQDQHEKKKQEILSHFDVFTDLDPLGTGKVKPYVDKKHFFQELKNPPKKVLNDLVVESKREATAKDPTSAVFPATFDLTTSLTTTTTTTTTIITNIMNNNNNMSSNNISNVMLNNVNNTSSKANSISTSPNLFPVDPFGEDPFVKSDPFAEADFAKQDPFENEIAVFNKDQQQGKTIDYMEQFKISTKSLSRSPKGSSLLEKQMSLVSSVSPRSSATGFTKQNTFDAHFDQMEDKKFGKLSQLHENPSLDLSSESECAPEPPPRPASNITQIKPPPLPPKKQPGELCAKPPPRPPHTDLDTRYDYIETYETAPNSLEFVGSGVEKSPPLPVPARKTKTENDFGRSRNKIGANAQEDDYLTPISLPKSNKGPILLPPPQKSNRKSNSPNNLAQVTVSSYLENKPNIVTTSTLTGGEKNPLADGLDITLSQLTLSGLNELATKLDIPAAQLSNMTLAQLTTYLSNFIKNKANETKITASTETEIVKDKKSTETATFPADFANFNNFHTKVGETYDRYAVFRELLKEEVKQTISSGEGENDDKQMDAEMENNVNEAVTENVTDNTTNGVNETPAVDKYAALREIVEIETNDRGKSIDEENNLDENTGSGDKNDLSEKQIHEKNVEVENEVNIINTEKFSEGKDNNKIIEYNVSLDMKEEIMVTIPTKSPDEKILRKSPVPEVITEIINNSTARLTSGSLSDVVSGSSPEIDNTGSNSEVAKKSNDATGESWAIFDQLNSTQEFAKDKQNVQSEEGVSPWSSDSKEFGNDVSPPEWEPRIDSSSVSERQRSRRRRGDPDGGGWWDTSAEPETQYYPSSTANRRSTDSYDDEYYECYEPPRRRRQGGGSWIPSGAQIPAGGGHSSSSRDVSPWEEEPTSRRRDYRDGRHTWSAKHGSSGRQQSFERHRDKRHTDSWDEEDDYEYEEEHCNRFHWHGSDRLPEGSGEHHRWADEWSEDRKHAGRRRRDVDSRERWCCPDWNQADIDKPSGRYSGRWSDIPPSSKWRERERYYNRESQESPWEDEYPNDPEKGGGGGLTAHYPTSRRPWKRPSSASEMDRKTGEIKARQGPYHLGTGGSDGERDRRYKPSRRSKSRESPFSDISHNRHKLDPGLTLRSRPKHHHQKTGHFEPDYSTQDMMPNKKSGDNSKMLNLQDHGSGKKLSSAGGRKKTKDSPKTEEISRKSVTPSTRPSQSLFENDFVTTETESPPSAVSVGKRFTFENDFETSEADSPIIKSRSTKSSVLYTRETSRLGSKSASSRSSHSKQRSLFEDDFSPTEKSDAQDSPTVALTIKEEDSQQSSLHEEGQDSFGGLRSGGGNGLRKKILNKNRMSATVDGLKKSESVNIFARENDPFDDDFFSGKDTGEATTVEICNNGAAREILSPRAPELKWTEQFEDFDTLDGK